MPTAMQEMILNINAIESKTTDQEQIYMLTALQIAAFVLVGKEKQQMIDFYTWMRMNDTPENAEKYFHYSDQDMLTEYLNQQNEK